MAKLQTMVSSALDEKANLMLASIPKYAESPPIAKSLLPLPPLWSFKFRRRSNVRLRRKLFSRMTDLMIYAHLLNDQIEQAYESKGQWAEQALKVKPGELRSLMDGYVLQGQSIIDHKKLNLETVKRCYTELGRIDEETSIAISIWCPDWNDTLTIKPTNSQ